MLKLVKQLDAHRGKVWTVSWAPKGDRFISAGEDRAPGLYRLQASVNFNMGAGDGPVLAGAAGIDGENSPSYEKLGDFPADQHSKTVRDAAWSPCGKYVLLGSFDSRVTLWEVKSNGEVRSISVVEGHESEVKSVSWAPSGRFFATCGRDKNVMIWTVLDEADDDMDVECAGVLTSHTQDVKRVVWHPKEDVLASASYDDTIKIHKHDENDGDWSTVATLTGHTSTVWGIDFNADGNKIASSSADKTIKIWTQKGKIHEWACTATIAGHHNRPIYSISWNKRNGLIATGCGDNRIRIFKEKPATNELNQGLYDLLDQTEVPDSDINCVTWNPMTSDLLASACDDQNVHIWRFIDEHGTY